MAGLLYANEVGRLDTATTSAVTDKYVVLDASGELKNIAASTAGIGTVVVQTTIADVSTAGSAWVAAPVAGDISLIQTIIDGTIATSDATITAEINTVAVTGSSITIEASGSGAGDVDSSTPTAANTVAAGDSIEIITDGASTNAVSAVVNITITL